MSIKHSFFYGNSPAGSEKLAEDLSDIKSMLENLFKKVEIAYQVNPVKNEEPYQVFKALNAKVETLLPSAKNNITKEAPTSEPSEPARRQVIYP